MRCWRWAQVVTMAQADQDRFLEARREMVRTVKAELRLLETETDVQFDYDNVLQAMEDVPRHEFVVPGMERYSYENAAQSIGHGQTISQPLIVAVMTALADVDRSSKVLEVGTGSGYQAAVLARLAGRIYSVEVVEPLALQAQETLKRLGVDNVSIRVGDGHAGWLEYAPYDAIVVTAAPETVPQALIEQLKPGGRLVIPVGGLDQELVVIEKNAAGEIQQRDVIPVRFVPFTGA